jgi:hypothetical protein
VTASVRSETVVTHLQNCLRILPTTAFVQLPARACHRQMEYLTVFSYRSSLEYILVLTGTAFWFFLSVWKYSILIASIVFPVGTRCHISLVKHKYSDTLVKKILRLNRFLYIRSYLYSGSLECFCKPFNTFSGFLIVSLTPSFLLC